MQNGVTSHLGHIACLLATGERPLPQRKHNRTKDQREPLRLRVHLVAHLVGFCCVATERMCDMVC